MALACDYALTADEAPFVLAFSRIGLMPDGGATALVTAAVGRAGGNIVDLWHHREFGVHSARVTEIELLVETRDGESAEQLKESLSGQGYIVDDVPRRAAVRTPSPDPRTGP